jgi:Paraquat-inducible protein A
MLVLVLLTFLLNLLVRGQLNNLQAPILILSTLSLLLCGIITPMIQLEARIDLILFQLLGEEIAFSDQIIFFQSKSITNMVQLLMQEGTVQMIFVAVLIFSFSVLFPSLKLVSSYIYYMDFGKLRNNGIIKFFVLKSGKWSMADVMVVALFMAYIGFNGVIASQLDSIGEKAESFEVFTTNGTRLLGGFYLFLAFCLASLFLSEALTRRSRGMELKK